MIQIVDDNYNFCPDILYKYRKWDENGKKVLTDCQLYLARPDSFEDEFDCNPIIEPLSHEEFLAWTISKLKLQNPGWDYKILAEEAEKLWLISPMKTKEGFKAMLERMRKEFGNIFGVLSMTEVPDNPFMWNEYSGNHTGFCIGIDGKALSKVIGGCGEVVYEADIPRYKFGTISQEKEIEITILHKHSKYKDEREFRLTRMQDHPYSSEERLVHFPKEAVKRIIMGKNMSDDCKDEIRQIAAKNYLAAELIELS